MLKYFFTLLFCFIFVLSFNTYIFSQQSQIQLTKNEKDFLQSHPIIKFGTDETWQPWVSKNLNGELEGFDVDFLRHINEISGANIKLVTGRWAEIVEKAKKLEIDGLATSAPLEARKPFFNFTDVYASEFQLILTRSDSSLKIESLDDLSGKTVAIQKGNESSSSLIDPYPNTIAIEANSVIESVKIMLEGKADAAISSTSIYGLTHKHFLQSIKISYVVTEKKLDLVYSIRKDWPELISVINKSLAAIPLETKRNIYLKWFQVNLSDFSQKIKNQIQTIIVDNYYPYSFVNKHGQPDGFSVDLIKEVTKVMGLELKITVDTWENALKDLKTGKINVLPMMAFSEERDKDFDFSPPHTIAYDAVFTKKGSVTLSTLSDLKQKKIIVLKDDQAHDYLRSLDYISDDQLIIIDNLQDGLRKLSLGQADAVLMPKLVGLILLKKLNLNNLKLTPIVIEAYNRPFSFAVYKGNKKLLERLNQGLSIIKETDQQRQIYQKWFGAYIPDEITFYT